MRLRYVTSLAALVLGVGAVFTAQVNWAALPEVAPFNASQDQAAILLNDIVPAAGDALAAVKNQIADAQDMFAAADPQAAREEETLSVSGLKAPDLYKVALATQKPHDPVKQDLKLAEGDTLSELLQDAGVSVRDSILAIRAMSAHIDPRRIKAGQKLSIQMRNNEEGTAVLEKMTVPLSVAKAVIVTHDKGSDDGYSAQLQEKEVFQTSYAKDVKIDSSLYASAARVGVPASIIAELIRVYSWDVDFQRDIRAGDALKVMYSVQQTEDGQFAGYGDVAYASLTVGGKARPIYRYETKDGTVDYFQPDGHSIRKTLMKTPVDGARLSSGYGMRKHPVLGYNKMHKGLDFAAPVGTPIYAAGDAVVEYAGRKGSYGNYIRLRHNGTLKTAYAHMQKFAKGITTGKRVEQGQVIGYIGTTGRSTGPHLHYEVLLDNAQVNPKRVDLPVGEILEGQEYARFKALVGVTDQEFANLLDGVKVASFDKDKAASQLR